MRALVLTHRLPYPPNRGNRLRAFHILTALAGEMDVDVVSLVHDRVEMEAVGLLQRELGIRVTPVPVPFLRNRLAAVAALAGPRPLTHLLLTAPAIDDVIRTLVDDRRPDVVLAYCSGMAQFALRSPLSAIPFVLDMVDLDSSKWRDLAQIAALPLRWIYDRESRNLARFETMAVATAQTTLVVNDRERDAVRLIDPLADVRVLSNGVDIGTLTPSSSPTEEPRVVFCGVMNYAPNVEGILWFAREVWPAVRRGCPKAVFTIVGSEPTSSIRRLASAAQGIEVTGRVPDVSPYLWNAAVSVAPLRIARGLQNKVLEAVASGLPTVVTPCVYAGLPREIQGACKLATRPSEFAGEVIDLLRLSADERRQMAMRADCSTLGWEQQMAQLPHILRHAAGFALPSEAAV